MSQAGVETPQHLASSWHFLLSSCVYWDGTNWTGVARDDALTYEVNRLATPTTVSLGWAKTT